MTQSVGIHAGWGWSDSSVNANDAGFAGGIFDPVALDLKGNGVVGGFQVGYNWQFAPNWVIGIEGDLSGTGIRDTVLAPVTIGGTQLGSGFQHI